MAAPGTPAWRGAVDAALGIVKGCNARMDRFLNVQEELADQMLEMTKKLYDLHKFQEPSGAFEGSPLEKLQVKGFDAEQVWQQLELQNELVLKQLSKRVANLGTGQTISLLPIEVGGDAENLSSLENDSCEESDGNDSSETPGSDGEAGKCDVSNSDVDFDIDDLESTVQTSVLKGKNNLEDQFFSLSEMEAFLESEEKREDRKRQADGSQNDAVEEENEDEEVDYFEDMTEDNDMFGEDEEEKNPRDLKYKDYFEGQGSKRNVNKKVTFGDSQEEEENGPDEGCGEQEVGVHLSADKKGQQKGKSSFEKTEEKIRHRIQELETEALAERPWQLRGETTAEQRPENGLLEESLLFDHAVRMAPVITEQTTTKLEDMISQRIKDKAWDDVVRKEKPKENATEFKKRVVLNEEKSKLSLAEIYEQEFLKQTQKQKQEEENPQHKAVKKMMDSLFLKLDTLSNFQLTPKPPEPEVKVVSNLPAISLEEAIPEHVSDGALLAPEEVKEKGRGGGDMKGKSEQCVTDKKRALRRKKKIRHMKRLQRENQQLNREKRAQEKNKKPEDKESVVRRKKVDKKAETVRLQKLARDGKATFLKDSGANSIRSSQAFFARLQEVNSTGGNKKEPKGKKRNRDEKQHLQASKLKL
uniref:U3 small nucleolar ribonucleoprotein protein MPP10 isoform X1 n=2 Tax=Myxine glutinosa TaxID=7769 RepID=UPI00358F9D43